MKTKTIILLLTLFLMSCTSNKTLIIDNVIKEIDSFYKYDKNETINVIDSNCKINNVFFQTYSKKEEKAKKIINGISFDGNFNWDKKYRWSINKEDIDYFNKMMTTNKYIHQNKVIIKNKRVKIISNSSIDNLTDIDFTNGFLKNRNYYCLSNPVFNQSRDIAIIKLETIFKGINNFESNIIIYKKVNKKWIKICHIGNSAE